LAQVWLKPFWFKCKFYRYRRGLKTTSKMKVATSLAVFVLFGGVASEMTPMDQTVKLIQGLEKGITADGKSEQESFDAYACWCEKTMERKAMDISNGKELIAETQTLIKKLKGEIASHGAEIEQLKRDIAANHKAVKEATDVRDKGNKEYAGDRTESEQCIGAMEAAIKVLTGAGTKAAGFLETMKEAELLSVVAGVRTALTHKVVTQSFNEKDMDLMKSFVAKPDAFVARRTGMSAAQIGQNPFGDYAPQSSAIQGILKGMYDAFTMDLEKDNAAEAESQKSFEELMATKAQELETLELTLQKQETDEAMKTKHLSESEVLLDDTVTNLANDEQFFADTKEACKAKATEWSVRTQMRTEELNGMQVAIRILSSGDAKKTFKKSTTTFVQLSAVRKQEELSTARTNAYGKLKVLASTLQSRSVAKIAVQVQNGGHFDKVIAMVDDMISVLRKEEQDDIEHRDRCENGQNANKNKLADLKSGIKKTQAALKRMGNTKKDLEGEISALETDIKATQKDMAELLKFRNKEEGEFRQATKDDTDAAGLLKQAIVALSKYYQKNKIALGLVQKAPEYEQDPDKAPDATFASGDSRKSEAGGIVAILEMLVEDTEKELKEGRADNADAQEKYLKQNGALQATLDGQEETKTNTETEKADLEEKMAQYDKHKDELGDDKDAEDDTAKSIGTDCQWVKDGLFETRRTKRKAEIQGLVDAKGFLAVDGDPLASQ